MRTGFTKFGHLKEHPDVTVLGKKNKSLFDVIKVPFINPRSKQYIQLTYDYLTWEMVMECGGSGDQESGEVLFRHCLSSARGIITIRPTFDKTSLDKY